MATNLLTTPKAAAFAGVLFAVLLGAALVLLHGSMPNNGEAATGAVSTDRQSRITIAAHLMPFAAIAFLWFIAVVRDYLRLVEDRFYSTVFLGSGLTFLAMMLVSTAAGIGVVVVSKSNVDPDTARAVIGYGAGFAASISKTFAVRMGAVFMISLATIWLKTKVMPTWLVVITYLAALALMIVSDMSEWVLLAFPTWVFIVSVVILTRARNLAELKNTGAQL
ncbi:hypothetical protein [Gordonia sp. X0973]|uniref:hypothetical protein n=1 Tax=Gordonia sp. X0973 TaxID=2742602 RepID=UPI00265748A7|nr:hypothetical protein [Gordonia sp. X0973]